MEDHRISKKLLLEGTRPTSRPRNWKGRHCRGYEGHRGEELEGLAMDREDLDMEARAQFGL